MFLKYLIACIALLGSCWAEPPRAPYPPSGFRPNKPFPLPTEYGTPSTSNPTHVDNSYLPPLAPVRRDFVNIQRPRDDAYKIVLNAPVENLQLLPLNSDLRQPKIDEFQPSFNDVRKRGQYYVVNPDQSVQLVAYTTSQNQEQAERNDFTALLKYTNVGSLPDNKPVYQYTANGQIVRVMK